MKDKTEQLRPDLRPKVKAILSDLAGRRRARVSDGGVRRGGVRVSWSRNYNSCVSCGTTEDKHKSRGYCDRCYRSMSTYNEDFKFKLGDLIRGAGFNSAWSPLFMVTRLFRECGQDRCEGVDIRDGQTVREFRICECQRFGHFELSGMRVTKRNTEAE